MVASRLAASVLPAPLSPQNSARTADRFGKAAAEPVRERFALAAACDEGVEAFEQVVRQHQRIGGHFACHRLRELAQALAAEAGTRPAQVAEAGRFSRIRASSRTRPASVRTLGPSSSACSAKARTRVFVEAGVGIRIFAGEGFAPCVAAFPGAERGRSISISAGAWMAPSRPLTSSMGTASAGCSGKDVAFAGAELECQHLAASPHSGRRRLGRAGAPQELAASMPAAAGALPRRRGARRRQVLPHARRGTLTWRVAPLRSIAASVGICSRKPCGSIASPSASGAVSRQAVASPQSSAHSSGATARLRVGIGPSPTTSSTPARTRRWLGSARGASGAPNKASLAAATRWRPDASPGRSPQIGERQVEQIARLVLAAHAQGLTIRAVAASGRQAAARGDRAARARPVRGRRRRLPVMRRVPSRVERRSSLPWLAASASNTADGVPRPRRANSAMPAWTKARDRRAPSLAEAGFRTQAGGWVHGKGPPRSMASLRS